MTEPFAIYRNGCIRMVRSGGPGLPIGDDEARIIRAHMARPETRQYIGETADRYVRDLDAALAESARDRAEHYHTEREDVHA